MTFLDGVRAAFLALFGGYLLLLLALGVVNARIALRRNRLKAAGRRREEEGRYSDACRLYEQALEQIPRWRSEERPAEMIPLILMAEKAGETDRALDRAEQLAQSEKAASTYRVWALKIAADIYEEQGCEAEARQAIDHALAIPYDNAGQIPNEFYGTPGRSFARYNHWYQRARLLERQGRLAEALGEYERADRTAVAFSEGLTTRFERAHCLRALGRPEDALELLRPARERLLSARKKALEVHGERADLWRDSVARTSFAMAAAAGDLGRCEEGLIYLEEASGVFLRGDPEMGLAMESARAWLLALTSGRREEALRRLDGADELLPYCERAALLVGLPYLTWAALALEAWERARAYADRWRALTPPTASRAEAWYAVGESHLRQGDAKSACAAYAEAVRWETDAEAARRAKRRLAEFLPATEDHRRGEGDDEQQRAWWL